MSGDVQITWRGLTFGPHPFDVRSLAGWIGISGGSYDSVPSTRGHGQLVTPVFQGERIVLAGGWVWAGPAQRNALVAQLRAAFVPARSDSDDTEPLAVSIAGVSSTAQAQLLNFSITAQDGWAMGYASWSAQWRCPDPRVFGTTFSLSSPLVVNTTGLTLPHVLPMTLTAKPIGGTVTVVNPGNDPEGSPVVVTLSGAQSGSVGVTNVTTGRVVTFDLGLATTDVLVVDTERGGAFLNGEYRPASGFSDVVAALRAAPGVNVFRALGSAGAGSPSISVAVRPASW